MTGCSAVNCTNRSEQGFILKVFPKDAHRRALWASKVKRLNWKPTNHSYLCEVHFDEDQWEKTKVDGKRKLKPTAVPTIFSHSLAGPKRKLPFRRNSPNKKLNILADENASPSSENKSTDNVIEINELVKELEEARKTISAQTEELIQVRKKLRKLSNDYSKLKYKLNKRNVNFKNIFNDDQILALSRKKMSFNKWSAKTVENSFKLKFACGSKGYETLLNLKYPLPSIRTLQRRLQNLKFDSGILHEVFDFLKFKVESFSNVGERECVLLLDEMALKEAIEYDAATSKFFGSVTFPGSQGIANNALVFMIGGISSRWKQTVGYYFTNSCTNGTVLRDIIIDIIGECEKIGLHVNSITSDMGSVNRSMWKAFNISSGHYSNTKSYIIHPCDPNRTIEFLADVPHLLKNIKTSLISNKHFIIPDTIQEKYSLPTPIITSKHLKILLNYQKNMDLKLAPKLTEQHLNDSHFNKMKVNRARAIFSHDVSSALKFVSNETGNSELVTTAWFVEIVDKWFTLMTSRNPQTALSKHNLNSFHEAIDFLEEIIYIFDNLKIENHSQKIIWKPIQTGVILSTSSILKLQYKFLENLKFKFLLTSRFTQDSLESLFSIVRSKQSIPTPLQFKNNLKLISVAQYLKPSSNASYDTDDRQFFSGLLDSLKKPDSHSASYKFVLPISWDCSNEQKLSLAEENCLYNISGYIISKIIKDDKICNNCINSLGSKEKCETAYSKLVTLREFKSNCLYYVSDKAFQFFMRAEYLFRSLEIFLMSENINCKLFVTEKFNSDAQLNSINFVSCHNVKEKIKNRFITFRLKIFGLKKSKTNIEKKNKKVSTFSSKSLSKVN